jgi:hypothetical protein
VPIFKEKSVEKFNWIKDHFLLRQGNSWNHISDIVPNLFDEYYLVHWKVGIVENFPFDDYPEQNETIDQTNKRIKIEREFGLFLNPDSDKFFKEISLKEISRRFKKNYDYKLLNTIKQTPAIEILVKQSTIALKKSLTKMSNGQFLNLFVEDMYRHTTDDIPKQELPGIDIEKYIEIQENLCYDFCTYLFPDDLSWCLTTSEDLAMFLCIKKEIKHKFQNDFDLETFKIAWDADLY